MTLLYDHLLTPSGHQPFFAFVVLQEVQMLTTIKERKCDVKEELANALFKKEAMVKNEQDQEGCWQPLRWYA